jgi:molybdopterin converting factor subunit 1
MRITILLFARLREITGESVMVRDVPPDSTARTLWTALAQDFPEFDAYTDSVSTAINEEYARMGSIVSDGDEVAFLPPVSGG